MKGGSSIRNWWLAVGVLALTALGLGIDGYRRMLEKVEPYPTQSHDISDAIYGGFSLFLFNPPPWTALNWELDVARYLAPIAFFGLGATAIYSVFNERIQRWRMSRWKGHVIVCGLGYKGTEFVERLSEANRKVAVIEADRDNPNIDLCRRRGVPVIIGKAEDLPNLLSAGLAGAKTLLAVCPDDAVNTEIVAVARVDDVARTARSPWFAWLRSSVGNDVGRRRGELQCLAEIADPNLCELLRVPDREGTATSSLDFFNTEETSAHLLLERYPIDDGGAAPHILVAHLDPLGRRLVLQAGRKWHQKRGESTVTLMVTVVDDDADARIRELAREHPALKKVCEFRSCSTAAADIAAMVGGDREADTRPITYAYVTAHDDERGLVTALKLHYTLEPTTTATVVALSRSGGTSSVLESSGSRSLNNVHVFPTLKETCTLSLLQGGSFEPLAKAIHEVWNDEQSAEQKLAWDADGGEDNRESSRAQARGIPALLHKVGCVISPLGDWSELDFKFKDYEIETLAEAEHERWMKEKKDGGWERGHRDNAAKLHPELIPFSQLPDDSKEYNRETARNFPKFIALAGLQVVRRDPPSLTEAIIARLLADGREYRSKVIVEATEVGDDTEWTTSHGDVLHAATGDWWVIDGDDRWSVAGDIFQATYERVGDGRFRKTASVTAVAVGEPFVVQTLEGLATGVPGDYLVRNPSGECWPVPADVFERRYEES
jgi:hypothetical protein